MNTPLTETAWLTLAQIADRTLFTDGDWVESKDQDPQGSVRLTQLADVGVGFFRDRSDRWLREDQAERLNCTYLEPDDVLIARMPEPLGRACIVPRDIGRAVTVVDVAILRPDRSLIKPRYLMWILNSPQIGHEVISRQSGTTRRRISRKNLASLIVPVPPLAEQERIVSILEDHLSRLDAADDYLTAAARRQMNLARAWTSANVEGEGTFTPLAEVVLDTKTGWDRRRDFTVEPPEGHPYLKMNQVNFNGTLDLTAVTHVQGTPAEADRYRVRVGDVLFNNRNSRELVGKTAIVDERADGYTYNNNLVRMRFSDDVIPAFAVMQMNSTAFRRRVGDSISASTNVAAIYTRDLLRQAIWVPSVSRQKALVEDFNDIEGAGSRLSSLLSDLGQRTARLRRNLLSAVFSGQLVARSNRITPKEEMASA